MKIDECSHFDQVRTQNRKTIRNLMRHFASIGKSELARISRLSFPTVSAVLNELLDSNEVIILPEATSRGGRPGAEYALNPLYHVAICGYLEEETLHLRICDTLGNTLSEKIIVITEDIKPEELLELFQEIRKEYPSLSVISLGVPGVVDKGVICSLSCFTNINGFPIKEYLEDNLGLPVFMENDTNVFTSAERDMWPDLVHLFLNHDCIGCGILLNGSLIRGANGFAGELEHLLVGDGTADRNLGTILKDIAVRDTKKKDHIIQLSKIINTFICTINPPHIAISGFEISEEDLDIILSVLKAGMEERYLPQLHIVDEVDELYFTGLTEIVLDYWKSI